MLKDFRQFILRGNVVDLAVGVIIGAAFNGVVQSLVKDIITPLISAIAKQHSFADWTFSVNGSQFAIGDFLNSAISFLIVAATVFFFVVTPINTLTKKFQKGQPQEAATKTCPECLSNIPKGARRCAYCTAVLDKDTGEASA